MHRLILACGLVAAIVGSSFDVALATKPGEETNPNGFPSGPHYNLNIHGKKSDFQCPEPDPLTGEYGASIFIPVADALEPIEILMQSGKGKKFEDVAELTVLDPCTADFDGTPAVIQLPKNDAGYRVYARVLADPQDEPTISILGTYLQLVEDEDGNQLYYMGDVNDNTCVSNDGTLTRTRGKSKAVDISCLFEFTGDVCYLSLEECELFAPDGGACVANDLCCIDEDLDDLFDVCEPKPLDMECAEGEEQVAAYCTSFEDEWVFNIAALVELIMGLSNDGVKLLQLRFYLN